MTTGYLDSVSWKQKFCNNPFIFFVTQNATYISTKSWMHYDNTRLLLFILT